MATATHRGDPEQVGEVDPADWSGPAPKAAMP